MATSEDLSEQDRNKQGVRDYFIEVIQNGRVDLIGQFLGAGYEYNGQPTSVDSNAAFVKMLHDNWGNFTVDIVELLAQEDRVAIHWRANVPADPAKNRSDGFAQGINIITCTGGHASSNVQVGGLDLYHL